MKGSALSVRKWQWSAHVKRNRRLTVAQRGRPACGLRPAAGRRSNPLGVNTTPRQIMPKLCFSLRLSETPMKVASSPYLFAGELIFWVVAVAVFALTWSLGDITYAIAAIVAILVVLAVFRSSWQRSQRQAAAERGRYYCESCHRHFEGDSLRQVTNWGPSH
jgi:hypothetical protein